VWSADDGLCDDTVLAVAEHGGCMWLGTFAGLCGFDGERFLHLPPEAGLPGPWVMSIVSGDDGALWLGCGEQSQERGGLVRLAEGQMTVYTVEDGLGPGSVSQVLPADGELWVATLRGGVSRFDGTSFERHGADSGLPDDIVSSLGRDADGDIWIGTGGVGVVGGGVARYMGRRFERFTTARGLPSNNAICLLEDSDGCIWMGTWHGLSVWEGCGSPWTAAAWSAIGRDRGRRRSV